MVAAAGLAAYPAAQDIRLQSLALGLAMLALLVLTAGLAMRSHVALGTALAVLGGEYAVLFAAEGGGLDRLSPVYAIGFLLVGELAFWSIEGRVPAWTEPELVVWRLARLGVVCMGAAAVGALVAVDAAAARSGGGTLLEAAGVAAAIGSLALLIALVRRSAVDSEA